MSNMQVDEVIALALQLSPAEQARIVERLAAAMHAALAHDDEPDAPPWTDDEIAEMLKIEPLTGADIVAAKFTGGWADLDIHDGAEWVNERKRKRKEQRRW